MFSKETFIHDAELEIIIPNGTLVFNEENIDNIIDAQQRTQVFYGNKKILIFKKRKKKLFKIIF
jgi:hypothetical protein